MKQYHLAVLIGEGLLSDDKDEVTGAPLLLVSVRYFFTAGEGVTRLNRGEQLEVVTGI